MSSKFLLLSAAAAVALAAAPAPAQQPGPVAEGKLVNGVRVVELTVTGNGFEPSNVKVRKGEKVRLVVTRKTQRTCATEIVIKDAGINTPLPLDKAVAVEFTPSKTGELRYTCGMGMIGGTLFVL
jgi:plastocyanin domain-containing protein